MVSCLRGKRCGKWAMPCLKARGHCDEFVVWSSWPVTIEFLVALTHGLMCFVFRAEQVVSGVVLNIFVLGFITAFFIFAYFGLFTALTASTPGLLWMDLEVCSYDGSRPRAVQSFSRAFGYLVSLAGLLLGFIWALVDSEGLTWHDRISCTYITTSSRPSAS